MKTPLVGPRRALAVRAALAGLAFVSIAAACSVRPYLDMHAFSGTVLVARRGKVLVSRGYGFANIEKKIAASEPARYGIGSRSGISSITPPD